MKTSLADTSVDIGQFIRRHKFDTAVEDGKYCVSGCALAWLGGARRFLGKDSHVGFHSAQDTFPDGRKVRSVYGNKRVANYLAGLGYPERLANYISATDPWSIRYLTENDAAMYHIDPHPLSEIGKPTPVESVLESKGLPPPFERLSPPEQYSPRVFKPQPPVMVDPDPYRRVMIVPVPVPVSRP